MSSTTPSTTPEATEPTTTESCDKCPSCLVAEIRDVIVPKGKDTPATTSSNYRIAAGVGYGFDGANTEYINLAEIKAAQTKEDESVAALLNQLRSALLPNTYTATDDTTYVGEELSGFATKVADVLCVVLANSAVGDVCGRLEPLYSTALGFVTALAEAAGSSVVCESVAAALLASTEARSKSVADQVASLAAALATYKLISSKNVKAPTPAAPASTDTTTDADTETAPAAETDASTEETETPATETATPTETVVDPMTKLEDLVTAAGDALESLAASTADATVTDTAASTTDTATTTELTVEAKYEAYFAEGNFDEAAMPSHRYGTTELSSSAINRIVGELAHLPDSLPCHFGSSAALRMDEDNLSRGRFILTGPEGTPYENGVFAFDFKFPANYPTSGYSCLLKTTGGGYEDFNPNLYGDGTVCLSLLGTWDGDETEMWNPDQSTFLQLVVSIQSLILVPEPYFNEPGYEADYGTDYGMEQSDRYSANIRRLTVQYAILDQILDPEPGFEDLVRTHFYVRRDAVYARAVEWLDGSHTDLLAKLWKALNELTLPEDAAEIFGDIPFTAVDPAIAAAVEAEAAAAATGVEGTEGTEGTEGVEVDASTATDTTATTETTPAEEGEAAVAAVSDVGEVAADAPLVVEVTTTAVAVETAVEVVESGTDNNTTADNNDGEQQAEESEDKFFTPDSANVAKFGGFPAIDSVSAGAIEEAYAQVAAAGTPPTTPTPLTA